MANRPISTALAANQKTNWNLNDTVLNTDANKWGQSINDAQNDINTINAAFDGLLPYKNLLSDSQYHYRDVASYYNNNATITGTIKITLPTSWTDTMLYIKLEGYNFANNTGAWEAVLSGYNHISASAWLNGTANLSKGCPFSSVRFAFDGTNCCILLGTTSSTWSYESIVISEVLASFQNQSSFGSGWSISLLSSETGIANIVSAAVNQYAAMADITSYGLGTTSAVLNAVDINTIMANGFYYCISCTNIPDSKNGYLQVEVYSSNYKTQRYIDLDTGYIWVRTNNVGTWSGWNQVPTKTLTDSWYAPSGYGLGGKTTPQVADANTALNNGWYLVYGTSNGGLNVPAICTNSSYLFVETIDSANTKQTLLSRADGNIYYRHMLTNAWQPWQQLFSTKNTIPIANGGTGATTQQAASDAIHGEVTSGYFARGNGSHVVMAPIQATDVPTLNQNTTGTAANVTGTVAIANGGTGATTAAQALTNLGAAYIVTESLGQNGYRKWSDGTIEQWGYITPQAVGGINANTATVTFPLAFPTGVYSIIAGIANAISNVNGQMCSNAYNWSNSGFTFELFNPQSNTNTAGGTYYAIGH